MRRRHPSAVKILGIDVFFFFAELLVRAVFLLERQNIGRLLELKPIPKQTQKLGFGFIGIPAFSSACIAPISQ
jgi:hypothetical protein